MNINNGGAPRAHEETMSHYRFDRPGFLAIAPDAFGATFAAAPRGGIPNQMI